MNSVRTIARTPHPLRQYAAILLLLGFLALLTWAFQWWSVQQVRFDLADKQAKAVSDAFRVIERDFSDLDSELQQRARSLAEMPAVVEGLRERATNAGALEQLTNAISEFGLSQRTSVEIYDPALTLVAWNGFSMPMDSAGLEATFLDRVRTSVSSDGLTREAVVVWWPVREGSRVLGAVRVVEIVSFTPPIRNQYLTDYSLEENWERMTGLPVDVDYRPFQVPGARTGVSRQLRGADGDAVARVTVYAPTPGQLVDTNVKRARDVLSFWLLLSGFWLFAGLWHWYRCACGIGQDQANRDTMIRIISRFGVVTAAWWGLRFLLIYLNLPAAWQSGKAPLAPLFDPTHLASTFGGGLMRSVGDLFVTSVFAIIYAVMFVEMAARFRDGIRKREVTNVHPNVTPRALLRVFGILALHTTVLLLLISVLGVITRHAILDSTLDYFSRSGFVPPETERLVLVVFSGLLILTMAAFLIVIGLNWIAYWFAVRRVGHVSAGLMTAAALGITIPFVIAYLLLALESHVALLVAAIFLAASSLAAVVGYVKRQEGLEQLNLRSMLTVVALLTLMLYPLFYQGMDARRRAHIVDAADTFEEGRDPRVVYALEQAVEMARNEPSVPDYLRQDSARVPLDSLARESLRGSLLFSLGPYDVSLTYLRSDGHPIGRYYEGEQPEGSTELDEVDSLEFDLLRAMYRESDASGILVEQVTGRLEQDRFQYAAIAPIGPERSPAGWVMARAEPQTLLNYTDAPFPRVLLPAGVFGTVQTNLSLAEFRNYVLTRSLGRDFGRYRLSPRVRLGLNTRSEFWTIEEDEGTRYLTYYRRREVPRGASYNAPMVSPGGTSVVAVRSPALNTFDHLYYLLRLTIAGLVIGLILYFIGLAWRRKLGTFSLGRVRFRDRVLNAFLGVGIISVVAVGFVGQEVISSEARGTIQSWLRQHLERVEETLALEARGTEMPYHVLTRSHVDSLAARVGLDLNVYQGRQLRASSRPQLVRDRLLDLRMPIQAYKALYFEGHRFVETTEQIGNFRYRAGYRALLDEQGRPRFVIAVPTLPEQERLEEEEARTIAYLFGSLLLLVLVVLLTASLMANALTRPIARLRSGLQAVARGRFEQTLPVDSRDEFGELAETFNEMQGQLSESRRQLAQQERQLAWREMARQVAHEIKNPLTPMKLSVQHLRRAFSGDTDNDKFAGVFERVTTTLTEQIDTLARIADDFHSFARLPTRVLERMDLNRAVHEAVSLMQENTAVEIVTDLHSDPLVIEADREEIRRVYINLIKNAIEAIPEGEQGRIEITTRLDSDSAYSTVRDNGTGIEPEMRDKIFQPNFSTKTSGTGLGLAITRKSIEDFHGEIGFETEEGEGSTFWIRLPLAPPEE